MLQVFLEAWGGGWFILNKIAFSLAERRSEEAKKRWRVASWIFYLIGLPAWLIIFVFERNWIVFMVEGVGILPVCLALYIAVRGLGKEPAWLDWAARIAAVIGIGLSAWDVGGLTTLNQGLELGSTLGFLIGAYTIPKHANKNKKNKGYLWFILMNGSMGLLVARQGYWWLAAQQAASLLFVLDAYLKSNKN